MSELQNKVIIITEVSSELGEATAGHLAASGAKLMLAAHREDQLKSLVAAIEETGGTATYRVTNVADRAQVQALADATLEIYGRIDVLINNVGLMSLSPFDPIKVDEWDQTIDVNIKGVLYAIAAVLPTMRRQKSGHVINFSPAAEHKVFSASAVSCVIKSAVRAISEELRLDSNGEIRATDISPGAVNTELTSTVSHEDTAAEINQPHFIKIDADTIAWAIAYAIDQPSDVDVNEITICPPRPEL